MSALPDLLRHRGSDREPRDRRPHGQEAADALVTLGAHRMLQVRTRVLDDQLDHDINRWHPSIPASTVAVAA